MGTVIHELLYAFRRIRRTPAFAIPVILVLAIGIAANGAILSLSETLLRKPLDVSHPEELLALFSYNTVESNYGAIAVPDLYDYRSRNSVFRDVLGYSSVHLTFRGSDRAERISVHWATDNYFLVLGTRPHLGRLIMPRGESSGVSILETVLSFDFWQRRLGGDPEIVGEVVYLNRHAFTVVGIAAEGFRGTDSEASADLWIPIDAYAVVQPRFAELASSRGAQVLTGLGRLKSDVDLERAEREMRWLAAQLAQDYPDSHADWSVVVEPAVHGVIDPAERKEIVRLLGIFGAATGLLLVIICASVTSLLLAQAMARGPEIAVRLALGAPRHLLLRGFATEYVVLALLGGGIGLGVARGLLSILSAFRPSEFLPIAQGFEFQMSGSVTAAVLLLALLAGAVSGVVPVSYMFTIDLRSELGSKATAGTPKTGRSRLWSAFVVGQVGLSTVLLVGAGLAFESWRGLSAIDLGFEPRGVTLLALDLHSAGYEEESGIELYQDLRERLEGRHGVESVSLATTVPLGRRGFMKQIAADGRGPDSTESTHSVTGNVVSPGYFRTVGIPLLLGRDFERHDSRDAPGVVIVNETLARTIWPGEEVVGKTLRFVHHGRYQPAQVVGVVRDSWHLRDRRRRHGPHFYLPLAQQYQPRMKALVKARLPEAEVSEMAAEELRRLDPDLALDEVTTFPDLIDASLARERTAMALLGASSLLALLLAALGLYATLSYLVARRTAEIGLRMALGARPADILTLVIGRGLLLSALGLGLGLLAATWTSGLLSGLLYGVETLEPSVYGGVAFVVLSLSGLAGYLPAKRSVRIHPAANLMQSS